MQQTMQVPCMRHTQLWTSCFSPGHTHLCPDHTHVPSHLPAMLPLLGDMWLCAVLIPGFRALAPCRLQSLQEQIVWGMYCEAEGTCFFTQTTVTLSHQVNLGVPLWQFLKSGFWGEPLGSMTCQKSHFGWCFLFSGDTGKPDTPIRTTCIKYAAFRSFQIKILKEVVKIRILSI